ncbi:tRNA pseudouridine(13) synthase TruD, partial [Marinobacter sp. Z-F4-2]
MSQWRLDWPTSGGGRIASGRLKTTPGDFIVDEFLEFPESGSDGEADANPGSGEHLCLKLEKVGDNTEYVARELARMA